MSLPVKKENKEYTYGSYLNWPHDERWEIIEGVAYNMSPAPSRRHQEICAELFGRIWEYLKDKPCMVYAAPLDVRLPRENEDDENTKTVVQPDIIVVCDKSKLDDKGVKGAPDLIMEVVSPATASLDYIKKLELYEKNKVKEYWIVHPIDKVVMVYKLQEDGKYGRPEIYSEEHQVKVGIFNGDLTIDLKDVYREFME